jgi:hypothetical protein
VFPRRQKKKLKLSVGKKKKKKIAKVKFCIPLTDFETQISFLVKGFKKRRSKRRLKRRQKRRGSGSRQDYLLPFLWESWQGS